MKVTFLLVLGLSFVAFTAFRHFAKPATVAEGGIVFFEGTWQEALLKSKAEGKPIFLDVYASWCGPCKKLKKNTFSDVEVETFFNENFINVGMDGESENGRVLAVKYSVRGYPSLMFVNGEGKVFNSTMGYYNARQFMDLGRESLANFQSKKK